MLAQKELKTMEQPRFKTAGDAALIIQWDLPPSPALTRHIAGLKFKLDERKDRGVIDTASAYTSLLLYYDPLTVEYNALVKEIRIMLRGDLSDDVTIGKNKTINIPVFYGDEYGPDLEYIAILKNMSVEEVIKIHCQAVYFVYMIGFLPDFHIWALLTTGLQLTGKTALGVMFPPVPLALPGDKPGFIVLTVPAGGSC
jgi:inhibitor of KinA